MCALDENNSFAQQLYFLSGLLCVSPPLSCMRVVVNDVTLTVWKNIVMRATSNRLDTAVPPLVRNAVKQRNKESKPKMLEISHESFQSSVFHMSVPFSLKSRT